MKKKIFGGIAVIAFCAALVSATTINPVTTSTRHQQVINDTMPNQMQKSDTSMNKHMDQRRMNDSTNQYRDSSKPMMMSKDSTSLQH